MQLEKTLANYIRNNDYKGYQRARYPSIQDGDELIFEDEDFSHTDFDKFSLGFWVFRRCDLSRATGLGGQPILIEDSIARNIDLRNTRTVIEAINSDFTGLLFNDRTVLARPENGDAGCSIFTNCILDEPTKTHFKKQGVVFSKP